jgi:hypothetical protein
MGRIGSEAHAAASSRFFERFTIPGRHWIFPPQHGVKASARSARVPDLPVLSVQSGLTLAVCCAPIAFRAKAEASAYLDERMLIGAAMRAGDQRGCEGSGLSARQIGTAAISKALFTAPFPVVASIGLLLIAR